MPKYRSEIDFKVPASLATALSHLQPRKRTASSTESLLGAYRRLLLCFVCCLQVLEPANWPLCRLKGRRRSKPAL